MSSDDIILEHYKGVFPNAELLVALSRYGVDVRAIVNRWLTGPLEVLRQARVVFLDGGGFEFAAYMPGVPDDGALTFIVRDHIGDVIDLAAWNRKSGKLATWCSRGALLGGEQLFGFRMQERLVVHRTVGDWLKAGCFGVVILDEKKARGILRRANQEIQIDSSEYAERLHRELSYRPRIVVPSEPRVPA
jgi:hypothetical protein